MNPKKKNVRRISILLCLIMVVSILAPTGQVTKAATALDKTLIKVIKGGKEQLKVKGTKAKVTWKSANKSIATVDNKGYVKGIKKGSTKVYATVSGKKYTCNVKVENVSISSKSKTVSAGSSFTLKLNGNTQKVSWSSSNNKVASVTSSGKVKGVAAGKATITAKVDNKKLTCTVTVKKKSTKSELESIHTAVKEAYGDNYRAKVSMSKDELSEIVGLKSNLYDDVIAEVPLMSTSVDRFIAVKPAAGKKDEVKQVLVKYKKYLEEEVLQYPMNMPKVKASKVVTVGDYVFFIMLGKMNDSEEDEGKLLSFYEGQNDIAIKAIKKIMNK
ncbi:Ig-like domain-containing protein [Anaerosporobacter sp.]